MRRLKKPRRSGAGDLKGDNTR